MAERPADGTARTTHFGRYAVVEYARSRGHKLAERWNWDCWMPVLRPGVVVSCMSPDRGFAGSPWIGAGLGRGLRLLIRWPKDYKLCDGDGTKRKAWQITRGKRSWAQRQVWDGRRRQWFQAGVLAAAVRHPHYEHALWLVVSRPGKGRPPWYLLTTEPINDEQDAWNVVFAYARRWQIEMAFRFNKSELACESPRLWRWEHRLKLLLMVSLVYAFLLTLLDLQAEALRLWLLRFWCHRDIQAVPPNCDTALPSALGFEPSLVGSSSSDFVTPFVKSGMTHVGAHRIK